MTVWPGLPADDTDDEIWTKAKTNHVYRQLESLVEVPHFKAVLDSQVGDTSYVFGVEENSDNTNPVFLPMQDANLGQYQNKCTVATESSANFTSGSDYWQADDDIETGFYLVGGWAAIITTANAPDLVEIGFYINGTPLSFNGLRNGPGDNYNYYVAHSAILTLEAGDQIQLGARIDDTTTGGGFANFNTWALWGYRIGVTSP